MVRPRCSEMMPGVAWRKMAVGVITTGRSAATTSAARASDWPAGSSKSSQVCGSCCRAAQVRSECVADERGLPTISSVRAPSPSRNASRRASRAFRIRSDSSASCDISSRNSPGATRWMRPGPLTRAVAIAVWPVSSPSSPRNVPGPHVAIRVSGAPGISGRTTSTSPVSMTMKS
jgi:hypothetical protein